MGVDDTKVKVGAGVISIGEYVAAGGAATLVDIGHTDQPFAINSNFESFDVESERTDGLILTVPIKSTYEVEFSVLEVTPGRLAQIFRQAAGSVTGTAPNQTIVITSAVSRLFQIQIVGKGIGTTGVRTVTFWRCQPVSCEPILHGKAAVQAYRALFRVLYDSSVNPPAGEYFKQVDA